MKTIKLALLGVVVFGQFDTFPDGWLGGWLGGWVVGWVVGEKIKNKDHLSLAEA